MNFKKLLATAALVVSPLTFADNILVVMSDVDTLTLKDGKTTQTGFYLNELMEPVKRFLDEGHDLTFATPTGMAPTLDKHSDTAQLFAEGEKAYKIHRQLLNDLKLTDKANSPVISFNRVEQIGLEKFDAFYAPGGHAPMEDLLLNDQLGRILTHFNKENKPTGLVCHGPIALVAAMSNNDEFVSKIRAGKKAKADSNWIYKGYKMTVFSNTEEEAVKGYLGGGELMFNPQDALTIAGGKYKAEADWSENVIVDRELVTGQNPASAKGVADAMLKMLK